jgi:hypothetical protein
MARKPVIPSIEEMRKDSQKAVDRWASTYLTPERVDDFKRTITESAPEDYEVTDSREPEDTSYTTQTAPTKNPKRPRALKLAYSRQSETLVVRFRDGTWWGYYGVPVETWNELKASESTGVYLKESGLDQWPDMGAFNPAEMSPGPRTQLNN